MNILYKVVGVRKMDKIRWGKGLINWKIQYIICILLHEGGAGEVGNMQGEIKSNIKE